MISVANRGFNRDLCVRRATVFSCSQHRVRRGRPRNDFQLCFNARKVKEEEKADGQKVKNCKKGVDADKGRARLS